MKNEHISAEIDQGEPVDLNMAPVTAPAAILPIVSCFPLIESIEELTPLYKRAIKGCFNGTEVNLHRRQTYPLHLPNYQ